MEAMLFSQRLTRLLNGDPDEGTLPDGAKLHIQNLPNEFDSVLRDFETSYRNMNSLERKEYQIMKKIHDQIIDVIRESENAIDTFFVNSIQNKIESSSQQLCHALQGLETKFSHIKLQILQLQAIQSYQTVISNFTSIKALFSNSCSFSGTVKRRRERQIINKKPGMVGREDDMETLLDFLIEGKPSLSSIAIFGRSGYGKTTLAAKVYDNIHVKNYFDCRVWVQRANVYGLKIGLLEGILKSLMPSSGLQEIMEKDDGMKKTTIRDYLRNKKYLIVLTNLWSPDILDDVLPDDGNGSRVLATTHSSGRYGNWSHFFRLRPLNDTEYLEMLTDEDCSNELESETVKRSLKGICHGWLFGITLLRGMLSGKDKQDALQMLEYLCTRKEDISSYYYESVPDYLKPCFVYFAIFPESYDISSRQLYQLWIAKGFIEENSETVADMYLEELTMRGFVHVTSRSSTGRIKTCRLHGYLVENAVVEAEIEMFIDKWTYWNSEDSECLKTCKRLSVQSEPTEFLSSEYSAQNLRSFLWLTSDFRNHTPMDCNYVFENSNCSRYWTSEL